MAAKTKQKQLKVDDLSAEARAVVTSKVMEGRAGFKSWRKLMAELAAFDAGTDLEADRANSLMILFMVFTAIAGLATFGVTMAQNDFHEDWQARAALIGAGCALAFFLALSVKYFIRKRRLQRVDLANDFRHLLPALFEELEEDMQDKGKVRLNVELTGPAKSKIITKRKLPSKLFTTLIQTTYRDPWLRMAVELADGNTALVKVDNFYTLLDRRRWQTSRSGKLKRKRKLKWRKVVVAAVSLLPAGETYDWDETKVGSGVAGAKLKRKQKKGQAMFTLVRKYKFKQATTPPEATVAPSEVVGMLMQLYSMLARPEDQAPPPLAEIK